MRRPVLFVKTMDSSTLTSSSSLIIQCAGIVLVALLTFFMTRSIRRTFLDYWTIAWLCLSAALISLLLDFNRAGLQSVLYSAYMLLEYGFGFFFFAGCRNYVSGKRITARHIYLMTPVVVMAVAAPHLTNDVNKIFIPHAAIIALFFGAAYFTLGPRRRGSPSPGLKVMSFALILLSLDFLHYVPVFSYALIRGTPPLAYLKYTFIYDLIFEILLGFGSVMAVMEDLRYEVEGANRELTKARDSLEIQARMDPLTEAFNRHAFCSLVEQSGDVLKGMVSGCVAVIDMDNLKPINDSLGHGAGDSAIRVVARAIRSVIRPYDLLFRWGGDEFLVVLPNVTEAEALKRIGRLNEAIREQTRILNPPVSITVSSGIAPFASMTDIKQAIELADTKMYARKHVSKALRQSADRVYISL